MNLVKKMKSLKGWFLLPLYFIVHGWQYYWQLVNFADVIAALIITLLVAFSIWLFSSLLFKAPEKRSLFTELICFLLFFTNPLMTAFKARQYLPQVYHQLLFIVAAGIAFWIIMIFVKKQIVVISQIVNTILALLIVVVFFQFGYSLLIKKDSLQQTRENDFTKGINLKKRPSIYLVVLDEYAGNETLKTNFGFNNGSFINFLKARRFHVVDSAYSNYSYTLLSMPSTLNGEYIKIDSGLSVYGKEGSKEAMLAMRKNNLFHFFLKQGYHIDNYSPFELDIAPRAYNNRFLPAGKDLLLYPTLLDDLMEKIPEFFVKKFGNRQQVESFYKREGHRQFSLMQEVLMKADNQKTPKFCYLHLMLPHAPYIWDSTGMVNVSYLTKRKSTVKDDKNAYLEQLIYTNKLMTTFVDSLLKKTRGEAVIILMSDHGFKSGKGGAIEDRFNSFNTIYFPDSINIERYKGMSNVNQFRNLLSIMSEKRIPLKADSLLKK